MAGASGRRLVRARERRSSSHCRTQPRTMAGMDPLEILLVEDSAEDAEMTLRALRKNNLANRVHWVKDGQEALDYLEDAAAQAPKLVMLDLKMPKVDGIEVLRQLKAR